MKTQLYSSFRIPGAALLLALLSTLNSQLSTAHAQGTAFTYQGRLNNNGSPAYGSFDLSFTLYSGNSGGAAVAGPVIESATGVTNGLFTVTLDFGAGIFPGAGRWMEIAVRTNGSAGAYAVFSPRQLLAPAPYAITASNLTGVLPAGQLSGTLPAAQLSGTYGNAVTLNNAGNSFTGNGAGLANVNAATLGGLAASSFWQTVGNAGTTAGVNFIGTTDNQPLELHVNGVRALRLEQNNSGFLNIIGGAANNTVILGSGGATIGGGSSITAGSVATVGGGIGNIAAGPGSFVGGGGFDGSTYSANEAFGAAGAATIGGGIGNYVNNNWGTVGGGASNSIFSGVAATIAGGRGGVVYGDYATIGGGWGNTASGPGSFVGGGGFGGMGPSGNSAGGAASTIGGGLLNVANGEVAAILGGQLNQAANAFATVAGGDGNIASGPGSFVGGGGFDGSFSAGNTASGAASTVSGGLNNTASGSYYSSVGGGGFNTSSGGGATVGGGESNTSSGNLSTIGGGNANTNSASYATIAGGWRNRIPAANDAAAIGGGQGNTANGVYATVPGGYQNTAAGYASFAAGQNAHANYNGSFVWGDGSAGASDNAANQFQVLATGGVGLYTGTANVNIVSTGSGALTFGTSTRQMIDLYSSTYAIGVQPYRTYFRADAAGGFAWFLGGSHSDTTDYPGIGGTEVMKLVAGGLYVNTTLVSTSDRKLKEHFSAVNPRAVLDKVSALPIQNWNYKADATSRHIGPMAQDFYAAFGVGPDDKHIAVVDEGGVALAAIQGLNQKLEEQGKEKDAEIKQLKQTLAELKEEVSKLAAERKVDAQ